SVEAGGQEPERAARPLEIFDGRPALAHQVDQGGMERVGRPQPLVESMTFLLGRLALGLVLGMGPLHLGDDLLVDLGNLGRGRGIGIAPRSRRWRIGRTSSPLTGSRSWSTRLAIMSSSWSSIWFPIASFLLA